MERVHAALGLVMVVGLLSLAPVSALAATVPGTAAQITSVDDLGATLWGYAKGTPGKLGALGLFVGGATKLGGQQAHGGKAAAGILGGVGMAFLPGIADGLFTTAAGASSLDHGLSAGWQFVVGLSGGRLLEDPLFVGILAGTVLWMGTHRRAPEAQPV